MNTRKYLGAFLVKGTSVVALFGVQVLLARFMPDLASFGAYNFLISVMNLSAFVVLCGVDKWIVREVAIAKDLSDSAIHGKLRSGFVIIFINGMVSAIPLGFLLFALKPAWMTVGLAAWVAILIISAAFGRYAAAALRGLNRVIASEASLNLVRPILLGAFALLLFAIYEQVTPLSGIAATSAAFLCCGALSLFLGKGNWPKQGPLEGWKLRAAYRESIPFLAIGVGLPLLSNLDVLLLGSIGSDSAVGLYSASARLINLTIIGLVSANLLITPKLPVLFARGDVGGMRELVRKNNFVILGITVLPVVALSFWGDLILGLFGNEFVEAEPILHLLLVGQVVNALCGPVNIICMMSQQQLASGRILLFACGIEALGCLFLVPRYGPIGAAWANVGALVFMNLALVTIVLRRVGFNPTVTNLFRK